RAAVLDGADDIVGPVKYEQRAGEPRGVLRSVEAAPARADAEVEPEDREDGGGVPAPGEAAYAHHVARGGLWEAVGGFGDDGAARALARGIRRRRSGLVV